MLIRALGKEQEAMEGNWKHPFSDVASWADKYVGFAYEKGLAKGVSATEFGKDNAKSDIYLTFMLRALGYDDSKGDFVWNEPDKLAKSIGILPVNVDTSNFLRADVVHVSWAALEAKLIREDEHGAATLAERLMTDGLLKPEEYRVAKQIAMGTESQPAEKGKLAVSTVADFEKAFADKGITEINIVSDLDITGEITFERNNDLMINIAKGTTLTISKEFIPVGCTITNDGTILVKGMFHRGMCTLINNGAIELKSDATFMSGVSNTENRGTFTVDAGAKLLIERGSGFVNQGTLTNNGYVSINDGGNVDNEKGSIVNNGTIDLVTYFTGDIKAITGTGTLNDNRD
jgi:hypothetical protein